MPYCDSMEGLHQHVAMEEWKLFPSLFKLNLKFLYEDHEHLHQTDSRLFQALQSSYFRSRRPGAG